MVRRCSRKIHFRLLLLVVTLNLIFYFWKYPPGPTPSFTKVISSTATKTKDPKSPRCQQNMSVANIKDFPSLPGHIQNFLYHHHCRNFPMLLNVPDKCGGAERSSEVFLLLVIRSSPADYVRRDVLRKTWAEERLHNGMQIRRLFISGTMGIGFEKLKLNEMLEFEQRDHNDILQWDFSDTHYNLTLKQILFLEWMETNCPHVRFLLNSDDYIFAHTDNMVDYLQSLEDNDGNKHLFTGDLIVNAGPMRDPNSKYYIPVQVWESNKYPPYCGGEGFLLSGYTASVIYKMSKSVAIHPSHDVYMGICLDKAGLHAESHAGMKSGGWHIPKSINDYDPYLYTEVLIIYKLLPADMFIIWYRINDPSVKCEHNDSRNQIKGRETKH